MATKTQRLKSLASLSVKAHDAQRKADEDLTKRDEAVVAARHRDDPATYQEIADAMGVTKDRVSQIIQAQKRRA
jgi:DNA-directed RNA polymerase sigma subunit (sigma70/sigma32)